MKKYPPGDILHKLATYRKVLFVREPITRLLSAFLSKFHPNDSPRLQALWEAVYGKEIVLLYRRRGANLIINQPPNSTFYQRNFLDIRFSEFIQYITDLEKRRGRIAMDESNDHWLPQHRIANACIIKYDFIGHFENFAIEGPYVLQWLGVDDRVSFPAIRDSRAAEALVDEYHKIPLDLLRRLWKYYRLDYEMFGYSFNDTLSYLMKGLFDS